MAILVSLSCLSVAVTAQPALKIHGAVSLKGLIDPHVAEIAAKSGVKIELLGNGADNGLIDLVEGRADVAMISIPLEDLANKFNKKNPGSFDASKLKSIPLGYSKFILVVNTNNPVRKVTDEQAAGLLSGKITSWKEVGGPDLSVMVVVPPKGGGIYSVVENQLLKTVKYTSDAVEVNNPNLVRVSVNQNIRAVGPLPASVLSDKVAALALDTAIQTPMIFVVRGDPSNEVLKVAEAVRPFIQ